MPSLLLTVPLATSNFKNNGSREQRDTSITINYRVNINSAVSPISYSTLSPKLLDGRKVSNERGT